MEEAGATPSLADLNSPLIFQPQQLFYTLGLQLTLGEKRIIETKPSLLLLLLFYYYYYYYHHHHQCI
jgi:hypothetical protein